MVPVTSSSINDGPDGGLTVDGELNSGLLFSYAIGKAGMVDVEEARSEGWVIPADEKAAREIKDQLKAEKTKNSQRKK